MLVFILKDRKRTNTSLIGGLEDIWKRYMKESQSLKSVVGSKLIIINILSIYYYQYQYNYQYIKEKEEEERKKKEIVVG